MNPTLELLANRKSIRAYSKRPITANEKDQILQVALPTDYETDFTDFSVRQRCFEKRWSGLRGRMPGGIKAAIWAY